MRTDAQLSFGGVPATADGPTVEVRVTIREPRVLFLAGLLSEWAWGEGKRTSAQIEQAKRAATEALAAMGCEAP